MDIVSIYQIGVVACVLYALFWSFVLDREKPPGKLEFVGKLVARCLFLVFILSVLVGFAYFALGMFDVTGENPAG